MTTEKFSDSSAIKTDNWITFYYVCPYCGYRYESNDSANVARSRTAHMKKHFHKKEE